MSFKIKALLSLVVICCGGVRNEVGAGVGADDAAAEDSALLTHFLKTIEAATDKEVLINVTSTILNNLCVCIHDSLNSKQLNVVNENVLIPVAEAPVEVNLDEYKSIYDTYTRSCHDLPPQLLDVALPRRSDVAKCSRFDFVRKYEESFIDNQLKTKFKKIMYDILIKTKDRHKYEIKKYNLYEKPQKFEKNAMRSVIIIITLNLSKSFKTKMESSAVTLSEVDAALEDKGTIYVDFIDPAYDPKHTKISSATNVSYCNLKSVLTVLLESEKNNLTKTFKLIRKGGTIKVYTSLSTNYAYERYSDICCYKNNTNSFCKTTKKDVDPEVSQLYKSEQTEQVNLYKETVSKIKTLIEIYNKRLIRRQGKTEKVQITNNKSRYYSNLVVDHKNRSTNFSDQHFTYHYKKFVSSKLNNIPNNEKEMARNNSFLATNHTSIDSIDSQLNSQRTTDVTDGTNNEVTNTVEAEKIYLKVCNYDVWSNTTMKDFSPYKYIISNNTAIPNNITLTPAPLQAPAEPKVSDNSWTDIPTEPYTSNKVGTTPQNTKNIVNFQPNETDLKDPLAYNKNNNGTTNIIINNLITNTPRSEILKTTRKSSNMFTKSYSIGGTKQSFLKSIQRTSPINVLNEVNYVSLMMNSLTPSNMNINKITKRWAAPNVTRITLQKTNGFDLLENNSFTTLYPSSLSTINQSKLIQSLKINLTKSREIYSTPNNNVTKTEWIKSSIEPTTFAKNGLRNRTITLNKKSPKRFIDGNQKKLQGKKASQNKVIQSLESKATTLNVSSMTVTSMQTTNKRNTGYSEGSTTFPATKGKTDNDFDLQTNAEIPTSSISSLKANQQSHPVTEYSPFTSNPTIQKDTTSTLQGVHNYVDTSIFPQVPTILYSETISSTSSFIKSYSKSETNTQGRIINHILNSHTNQTKILTNSNREIHPNSVLPVLKDGIIASHSVHNVTETASPQIPTMLRSEPVASTSTYFKQYKKSYTKPISQQLASGGKSRKNQTKSLTFKNSDKHQNSTTLEQTKTTTVYNLRTNNESLRTHNEPSNLKIQKEKVTRHSVENFTETAVSPQIPKILYSVPVTSTSSSSKNTVTSVSKPSYKDNDINTHNNHAKSLRSAKYSQIQITTEKTKTKLLKYSPTPKSTDMKKQIYSNLPNTTQKRKSDAKYKKNNFAKTTHQQNIKSGNTQVDYQNNSKKLSNKTSTKDSFYEYTPFSVGEENANLSYVSQLTTSTDSSNIKERYFAVNNNKDHHTGFFNSERESNSLLFEHQMNTAPLHKDNQISNKFATEATVKKTEHVNTKTSTKNYNETKQMNTKKTFTVSDNTTVSYNLINVPSTPQLLLKSKETSIPITSPKGQSDEFDVGADSTFLTSTKKMKLNKKNTSSKLRSRNTIDVSALVQTPTVSKLKLARVINVVDHTRGHVDLSSPQGVGQGETFAVTKAKNILEYGENEIRNYKNKTRNGPFINFPTYFKATKRANRIYDNFFKITQSANSIAEVRAAFPNENYDKKGIERRTSHKVNTVKISKDLFANKIAKSTLSLPNKYIKDANYKKNAFYRSSKTNVSLSKFQEVGTKDGNKNEITNINPIGSKTKTKLYREENNLSGAFNNSTYTYPMLQTSKDSRLSEFNDIVITTQPIQNNITISLEPHLTGDRVLDPTFNTSPQGRVPVTFIPKSSNKALSSQNTSMLEATTKRTPITSSNNLRNHQEKINKSDIATTSTVSNYMQTVDTRYHKSGKPVTSKKFSGALSTLTKTINSLRIKTFNISVPTELNSFNQRDQDDNMRSTEINTLSTIDHLDIKQSKEKNMSTTKYSSNFKDIAKTVKWFLQNATASEQTLAINTYKHSQYSNESLDLSQLKITNNSEIKTFSYSVNEIKSTKISVPFIQQNSIRLDSSHSSQTNITNEFISKANEITDNINVLEASIFNDQNEDHNMEKEFVSTTADHSEKVLSDGLSSHGKQNKSVDTRGTKVSLSNTSRLIESASSSPDLTKTKVTNDSNMQLSDSLLEATSSLIHLTSKPVHFEELEGTSNETNFTNHSYTNLSLYTNTPSTYFNDNKKENLNSTDLVKANTTTSEEYKEFQHLETNYTQFSGINITEGEIASWTDNILSTDPIKKIYETRSEQFETLVYFKSLVNSTTAVLSHSSNDNQQKAVHESYGSTLKDYTTSHPSNVSVKQINKSIEIKTDIIATKSTQNINYTLITKNNLSNTEHPPFSKMTQYLPEPLKTLRMNNITLKFLPDTILNESAEFAKSAVRNDDLTKIEETTAERDRLKQSAYRTTPLTNIKLSTDKVKSNEFSTTPTMTMQADNINNYNDIAQNVANTDFVSRMSSPLLQNAQSLNSYDNNTYAQYIHTESISLTFSSEAPPQVSPDEIGSETSATESYNESLQNIAQTLSDFFINTKNNNSIEDTIMFTNDSKNDLNKTYTICNGPLIIASNVILLTNPERCGNQSKIKSAINMRFPLIIVTNTSNPSMNMSPDINTTNKSIIKMDPMTVYNILLENAAKIAKQPNQYLRVSDLSETPWDAINIELGYDTIASNPNETRYDREDELLNETMQAIAQSAHETKKGNSSKMRQSAGNMAAAAPYSHDADSNRTRTNEERSTGNELSILPDTNNSTIFFSNPITENNYLDFTRQYEVLNNLKTPTFEKTHGTIPYNAYDTDKGKHKQNENKIKDDLMKRNEVSQTTKRNKTMTMPGEVQFNSHVDLSKSNDPYTVSKLSNHKNNFAQPSNPLKMFEKKNEASPYLSAAVNGHPNMFYRSNKKPIQVKKTKQKANVNSNNNRRVTTRTIMKHVTDTTKENKTIKYNSYQPASHISDVSLDSNMQFLLSLNDNNRKALSNAEITLFKKFNHKTTDYKNIFKLGRKDENDDQYLLKYNRRYKTITEKLKTSSTAAGDKYKEAGTSAQQAAKDLINFTRKQRTFFTINTKDFFSQRRFYSKDIFKDLTKARRVPFVLQYPATPRSAHVVLRPVFRNYGVVNVRQEQNVAVPPNARKDNRQYENLLKDEEKSKLSLWQDKIVSFQNLLLDELKSNVLEKPAPAAAAPPTERSVLTQLYNYNDLQGPAKIKKYYLKYLTGANNNKIAKNREVYRKKLEQNNFNNVSTTTESSSKRSRRTIFFLSPTVPYNRYF